MLFLTACGGQEGSSGSTSSASPPTTGQKVALRAAPDFSIETFDGQKVTLDTYKGKPLIVNFWASWCAPCKEEAPEFEKFYQAHKDEMNLLAIAANDRDEDSKKFMRDYNLSYPSGSDPMGSLFSRFGARALPTTYVINAKGQIIDVTTGLLNQRRLGEKLAEAKRLS